MTPGDHAADDGSFARSAGVHAGRAAALIIAALFIGFLVLDDGSSTRVSTTPDVDPSDVTVAADTTTTAKRSATTTTAALRPPEQVKVLALNATNTAGVAGKISDQLRLAKYNVLAPANATATAKAEANSSQVYFTAGYNSEALVIGQMLGLAPTSVLAMRNPPPATDLKGANIVVLVKEDLANRPAGASTTTTRKP